MASLTIRKLDDAIRDELRLRAARNGRSVEDEVHKGVKEWPWHREGLENCEWVLLDYINVVCHVFLRDKREFYGIEELWGDALQTAYED